MSECPACGSEVYDIVDRSHHKCLECGFIYHPYDYKGDEFEETEE